MLNIGEFKKPRQNDFLIKRHVNVHNQNKPHSFAKRAFPDIVEGVALESLWSHDPQPPAFFITKSYPTPKSYQHVMCIITVKAVRNALPKLLKTMKCVLSIIP